MNINGYRTAIVGKIQDHFAYDMHGNLHKSVDQDCVSRLYHNILTPSYKKYNSIIKKMILAKSAIRD